MNISLWFVQIVVALVFFAIGGIKVMRSTRPGKPGGPVEPIPVPMRILGGAEVLGAIGIILPEAMGIMPVLTIAAAVCLGIVMVGATIIHIKEKLYRMSAFTISLLLILVYIVIGRLVWVPLV